LKIKLVGCGYGDVVGALARQLNAASNSVDSLGKRTRVTSRKLKDVGHDRCTKVTNDAGPVLAGIGS
jgi:hypothetical protein